MANRRANGQFSQAWLRESHWMGVGAKAGLSVGLVVGLMGGAIAVHAAPQSDAPAATRTAAAASDDMTRLLLSEPPDLSLAQPGAILPDPEMITANTISQEGLTLPSLWWVRDQFGEQLLETWLVYPAREDSPQRVELVVNPQVWSIYNYMERYTFVNQFGASASTYGYSTRVFDRQGNLLAAYLCDFSGVALGQTEGQRDCDIMLRSDGIAGLTGRPTPAAATPTTPAEIGQR
ncbi:hypothetical protein HNI00_06545 [Thermoleptolyngbya oregonensis NK1-22]|uniref:Uncharacterized protein n=1 Tax=Thermoleptolyngbya oregonensis NK1-22 TaxID=2547457 RepID=A0AA96Y6M7_9CYAN|nr:hypothetical protein [Thermoleptolyngbya oregonensis]WOB42843.1 hypothetical protein HNI00_06545 [Thermoleptolyngbya oregonensis NK1-22]